jgi:hypothetical protein
VGQGGVRPGGAGLPAPAFPRLLKASEAPARLVKLVDLTPGLCPCLSYLFMCAYVRMKQIWVSQPRVWEGVVLLPKYLGARDTSDKTAQALLDLPLPQLQVRTTPSGGGKRGPVPRDVTSLFCVCVWIY